MIKLGNQEITLKIGSAICTVYLGDTMVESGNTPTPPTPSFDGKWLATYTGGTTSSAQCDSTSAITFGEITLTDLESVQIGDCVTSIENSAFAYCYSLSSITIPNSVTTIGDSAFNKCEGLTSCTIGSGVTSIGNSVFRGCTSLTSITIPNSVTSIGGSAFENCFDLTSVTIGSGVTSIGIAAFNGCSGLTSITIEATAPPTLSRTNTFDDTDNCPIYVPAQSVSAYKSAARWSTYASRIQAIQ